MHDAYQEHLLDASDVCSNCLRRIRVERVDPTRSGLTREYESHMTRHERHTEIGYGPHDRVSGQKGVFCTECGTESAFVRIWEDALEDESGRAMDQERFRQLVKHAIRTLEAKGVSIDRQTFAEIALAERADDIHADECLGLATEHAIVSAAMESSQQQTVRAD